MKILIFVINGHKWLFFAHHVEPNDIWAAGCKANQVRNGPNTNPLAILVLESGFWRDLIKLCSIFFVCFVDISSYYYSRGALCPNSYLTHTPHIILLWQQSFVFYSQIHSFVVTQLSIFINSNNDFLFLFFQVKNYL